MLLILGAEIAAVGLIVIWGGISGYMANILYALWYAPGSGG